ncbi:GMC family oxidoreductase [Alphaproteobacteria bacterium LSUCC0719]
MREFDYIIVGGGSAGCVLAERLTACGRHSVLLLEAGPSDRRLWVRVPIGYGILYHQRAVNWMYNTDPEPHLDGRTVYQPRGKVLGGSGSINALVYHRGQAGDYDDWAAAGNDGWGYDQVEAVYDRLETPAPENPGTPFLSVSDNSADFHSLCGDFVDFCTEGQLPAGMTARREGVGIGPYLTTTRNGMRCSSAVAFLWPAMRRANLTVVTGAHVERIGFTGRLADSVTYRHRGASHTVRAGREILVAAGAVGSPQLLQVSGVGPALHLRDLGIDVVHDQPQVGQHLQDHFGINYIFKANKKTLNDVFGSWSGRVMCGLEYLLRRRGPLALSVNQFGGLVKSSGSQARPDMQIYLNPLSYQSFHKGRRKLMRPDAFSGFIIGFNSCRPKSEGTVTIRSPRTSDAPSIRPNYLSHEDDRNDAIVMARVVERLQNTPHLKSILADDPLTPLDRMNDEEVLADFKDRGGTVFHLCGTCRMGPDPASAVVDARLRVHGIDGLRVCDASAFPNITSANTNAPTMMLADRAAEMILEDAK